MVKRFPTAREPDFLTVAHNLAHVNKIASGARAREKPPEIGRDYLITIVSLHTFSRTLPHAMFWTMLLAAV